MKGIADYVVVYDITSDSERVRVEKTLKSFGFRVQKSVFECRMENRGKKKLIDKLEKLNIKTGFIKIYRLGYTTKNEIIGKVNENDLDEGEAFIV